MKKSNKLVSLVCLTAAATGVIHAMNKIISYLSDQMGFLADPQGLRYNWKFGNIYYTKQGSGKPLLLIHDLQSYSSDMEWKELAASYAKDRTVYTMDLLGCGRSDKPAITYTGYLYVQLLTDFIRDVIGEPVDVITSGDSCALATMTCMNDSSLFGKLIFLSPVSIGKCQAGPTHRQKLVKALFDFPIIGTMLYNICHSERILDEQIKKRYFSRPYMVSSALMKSYYQAAHSHNSAGRFLFGSLKAHYTSVALANAIRSIDNSMTVIYGRDSADGLRIAEEYRRLNPIIEIQGIVNAKNLPQLEQPKAVFRATQIYL